MKKTIKIGSLALCLALFSHFAAAAALPKCEDELKEVNAALSDNGVPGINNVGDLAATLRMLNTSGTLPAKYITSEEAKRLGWSGKDSETLWGLKNTNGKWIGGDRYQDKTLPAKGSWNSADVDVEKGYRGTKRLVYSPSSPQRYFTPDSYQHFLEISPCQ